MYAVTVRFDGTPFKNYTYRSHWFVSVGDRVIVDAPSTGYTAVTVVDVRGLNEHRGNPVKWIVAKIDDTEYQQNLKDRQRLDELLNKVSNTARKQTALLDGIPEEYHAIVLFNPGVANDVRELVRLTNKLGGHATEQHVAALAAAEASYRG